MKKKILWLFKFIFIFIFFDIVFSWIYFNLVRFNFKEIQPPRQHSGLVFMHDFTQNKKDIGPETIRRIHHAEHLYNNKIIENIVCIGGYREDLNISGSVFMKNHLTQLGIPSVHIFIEDKSYDTWSNWKNSVPIIQKHQWEHILIISSPLHAFRIQRIISKNPLVNATVSYKPYDYSKISPRIRIVEIWEQIHYEWFAAIMQYVIPDKYYRKIIHFLRKK